MKGYCVWYSFKGIYHPIYLVHFFILIYYDGKHKLLDLLCYYRLNRILKPRCIVYRLNDYVSAFYYYLHQQHLYILNTMWRFFINSNNINYNMNSYNTLYLTG